MVEIVCQECDATFQWKLKAGRQPRYCGRKCYEKAYYRHPEDTKYARKEGICVLCGTVFLKVNRKQKFCSNECRTKGWAISNAEKHRVRQRQRRIAQPEWYAEHDPRYYKNYRAKLLSSRPWTYLLRSARNRALEKKWAYELTNEWAASRWDGCCEITGLPFLVNPAGAPGRTPFPQVLTAVNLSIGYMQANSRFILWGCNAIKGVGTDADMYRIASALTSTTTNSQFDAGVLSLPV